MNKIFEPRAPIKVKDLSELNIEELLKETFTITVIQTEKRNKDQTLISVGLFYYYFFFTQLEEMFISFFFYF